MRKIFTNLINGKEDKISFSIIFTFVATGISILKFIKGLSNYTLANKMANHYGIPSYIIFTMILFMVYSAK